MDPFNNLLMMASTIKARKESQEYLVGKVAIVFFLVGAVVGFGACIVLAYTKFISV